MVLRNTAEVLGDETFHGTFLRHIEPIQRGIRGPRMLYLGENHQVVRYEVEALFGPSGRSFQTPPVRGS